MKPEEKEEYFKEYKKEKEKGVFFFPDILYKDAIVSLCIFIVLAGLAYFVGAGLEERANPSDTSYTPRPEWYFLFLFQFLKVIPGELEVIGVLVIPGLVMLGLFLLPFIDRSKYRYFTNRPIVVSVVTLGMIGIIVLTILAATEAPPPAETAKGGDQTAALYVKNCAGCHGPSIKVPQGVNLHNVIARGTHGGMPGWSGDLSTDQIDALAGFIIAPQGSRLYTTQCGQCHQTPDAVVGNALEVRKVLDQGAQYPKHANQNVPDWTKTLSKDEITALLDFLVAPDGARLFAINCSACHGYSLATSKSKEELRNLISKGGQHVEMPAWKTQFDAGQREALARYVVAPQANPGTKPLYDQKCAGCHGGQIPKSASYEVALDVVTNGSSHSRAMPVWGQVLTSQQFDALLNYIVASSQGTSMARGQKLYAQYCASCHGTVGEGGRNPLRAGDLIPPISSAEYLKTHNDQNLRIVISNGLSSIGMPPFDGSLDFDSIEAIIAYMRAWEKNPPAEGLIVIPTPRPTATPTPAPVSAAATPVATLVAPTRGPVSFKTRVMPVLNDKCAMCHTAVPLGGWKSDTYNNVIKSGDHGPSVIPGNVEKSILAQKIIGTHTFGEIMPTAGKMDDASIQIILDWIAAGAPDN